MIWTPKFSPIEIMRPMSSRVEPLMCFLVASFSLAIVGAELGVSAPVPGSLPAGSLLFIWLGCYFVMPSQAILRQGKWIRQTPAVLGQPLAEVTHHLQQVTVGCALLDQDGPDQLRIHGRQGFNRSLQLIPVRARFRHQHHAVHVRRDVQTL